MNNKLSILNKVLHDSLTTQRWSSRGFILFSLAFQLSNRAKAFAKHSRYSNLQIWKYGIILFFLKVNQRSAQIKRGINER